MKSVIFLIAFFVTVHVNSQHITGTLGTGGIFIIKDATTTFFSLKQSTGYLGLGTSPNEQLELTKNFRLPYTTSPTTGIILKGNDRFIHDFSAAGVFGNNTFVGINSGNFSMSGAGVQASYNTGIGHTSLFSLSSGSYNTALGNASLYSDANGSNNTAIGFQSLFTNGAGSNMTALGSQSLYSNTSGYENTALGTQSLYSNTSGYYNLAAGTQSLYSNTSGYYNTSLGIQSLYLNISGYDNSVQGYQSMYTSTTGYQNSAVGFQSLYSLTTGYSNSVVGYLAGSNITTGINNTVIGANAMSSSGTVSNEVTLGNSGITSLRCSVIAITSLSDRRDKKNITDLTLGLDFLSKLKPRQFNWDKREWYSNNTSDGSKTEKKITAGFIAQELDETQVTENAEWLGLVYKDSPEKWEATYGNLLPVMVKAIQELKSENDKLRTEVDELKKANEDNKIKQAKN